jgi:hypothetical protein
VDEFKANTPLVRGSTTLSVTERDFDNPFLVHHLEVQSGGTRSAGTRVLVDLDFIRARADDMALTFETHNLFNATHSVWLQIGGSALIFVYLYTKVGCPPVNWFTQVDPKSLSWHQRVASRFLVTWSRLVDGTFARPEWTSLADAPRVARWMAAELRAGRTPCLTTFPSSAMRVFHAAADEGLSLSGSVFLVGGEPLTQAKRKTIEGAGGSALVYYGTTEAGHLGCPCATPMDFDDVHFLSDNFAMIQYPRQIAEGVSVEGLLITSLLPEAPKIFLNAEMGDYAEVSERECGCVLGRAGLTTHLSGIRSFEKLTGEGMTFVGTGLVEILEEVLPRRFGGQPTDYQLVEYEDASGMTRLELRIAPEAGAISEGSVREAFFAYLDERSGLRAMANIWKQAGILEVRRVAPLSTRMGKVLPFYLVRRQADLGEQTGLSRSVGNRRWAT